MTVYLVMTALSCFFAFLAEKFKERPIKIKKLEISSSALWLCLAALPLILVGGLRWETGVDHMNYYWVFTNILFGYNTHVEIGFKLLIKLLLTFTEDLSVLFFVCTAITVGLMTVAIKLNSKNYALSYFLYISMGYFYYSMNSIRHFMAVALYFIGFKFLKEKKFWPYLFFVLAASSFHKIALVALPLYFILNVNWKRYVYPLVSAGLLVVWIFHRRILDFVYHFIFGFYKDIEAQNVSISFVNIGICLALSILCFIYREKLLKADKSNVVLINSAYFGLIFFAFCSWIPLYTRIGQYLVMLSIFLIPEIINAEERKNIKLLYTSAVAVGFTAFMIVMLLKARDPHIALMPYKSVFQRESYMLERFWFWEK